MRRPQNPGRRCSDSRSDRPDASIAQTDTSEVFANGLGSPPHKASNYRPGGQRRAKRLKPHSFPLSFEPQLPAGIAFSAQNPVQRFVPVDSTTYINFLASVVYPGISIHVPADNNLARQRPSSPQPAHPFRDSPFAAKHSSREAFANLDPPTPPPQRRRRSDRLTCTASVFPL